MNIRDRTIPHSFFVERPPDCPYRKDHDDFYHKTVRGGEIDPTKPVKPTWKDGKAYCGWCGKRIPLKIKAHFCHKCGKEIDWIS